MFLKSNRHLNCGTRLITNAITKMVGVLDALRAAVSSNTELVLGCSPNETSWVEVTNDLVPNSGGGRNCSCGLRGLA
jgi:hypothetical protein